VRPLAPFLLRKSAHREPSKPLNVLVFVLIPVFVVSGRFGLTVIVRVDNLDRRLISTLILERLIEKTVCICAVRPSNVVSYPGDSLKKRRLSAVERCGCNPKQLVSQCTQASSPSAGGGGGLLEIPGSSRLMPFFFRIAFATAQANSEATPAPAK
jgi:hypothetical protein